MKVTQVSICPTEAATVAGRPALTPELLAASGARYSRNNEGLDAILDKIDPNNLDKSVESIFRMIDYGHQSIADMVPVAMFMDDVSIWLAYYLWSVCPTAGGQESSTRYIKLSVDELVPAAELDIPEASQDEWRVTMQEAFAAYFEALTIWEQIAEQQPEVSRIPLSLLNDPSDKAQRAVARMKRNYAFDRSRYFLPVAATTNVMLVMSARGWVQLCQLLLSHPLPEARQLGAQVQSELRFSAPRLLRHATAKESAQRGQLQEFERVQTIAKATDMSYLEESSEAKPHPATPFLTVLDAPNMTQAKAVADLAFHDNRYAWIGSSLQRTVVRFGWDAVALGEIRDLNRHRTGTKYAPLVPRGFYCAIDQLPRVLADSQEFEAAFQRLARVGRRISARAASLLKASDPTYVYWTLLGTQYPFEHTTTADKFLYEAELRTGTGAHFRYAQHLRDVLTLWYERFPETRGIVLEGSAEPE